MWHKAYRILGVLLFSLIWLIGGRVNTAAATTQPILVVVNSASPNPFGRYLGEILRAEGVNMFSIMELNTLDAATLSASKLVVLAETPLSAAQTGLFNTYVGNGGKLIAMRPDAQLATALGVTLAGTSTTNGYVQIDGATPSGAGFTNTTLPFYGAALNLTPAAGATTIAKLYSGRDTATAFGAVVRRTNTVAWAYDLARSVAYARQGDPANAGTDRDDLPPLRTNDVFYNAIDKDRVAVPHADVQMRLLVRLINDLLADQIPLPRLWYFPDAKRTLMVLTGDAHANPNESFQGLITSVEGYGGRISLYVPPGGMYPTSADVKTWLGRGHEIGMHPYGYASGQSIDAGFAQNATAFAGKYGSPPSRTERLHQVEWQGWVDAAKVAANHNIGLDTNFYTWGTAVRYANGSQAHGYINGSARPMRFVDEAGVIVPVYQQVTSLIDEQLLATPLSENLPTTSAIAVSRQLIDASQAGDYAAITTQFHVDYYSGNVRTWAEGTMDYARSLQIPMWTAEHWLNYNTARDASTFGDVQWTAATKQLSFTLTIPAGAEAQSVALPYEYNGLAINGVLIDGAAANTTQQQITGRLTNFVNVGAGTHSVVVRYDTPPAATATPTATATATPTATAIPGVFPKTAVLDDFNRPDGPLAIGWTGAPNGYSMLNGRLVAGSGGPIYCCGTYGSDQEVFVTFTTIPGQAEEIDLLLKVQNGAWTNGAIEVVYVPITKAIQVYTYTPGPGWQQWGANITRQLNNGDQFGARFVGSTLEIYHNGALAASRDLSAWPLRNAGGTAGLWMISADGGTFDNFGGGTLASSGPTPTATATATSTPTNTPTSTPTNTPTPSGPTPTPKAPPSQFITQTTLNDWGTCDVAGTTLRTLATDGEIRLAAAFGDEYDGSALDTTKWTAGAWNGGSYTPLLSNGILSLQGPNGVYVRSATNKALTTFETTAQFSAAPWEHLGWGSLNFANDQYLLFSTFNGTTNLYARSNGGNGEQRTDLGPLPAGFHTYRITRTDQGRGTDLIQYYIDGAPVAQHTVASIGSPHVYQSQNGLAGAPALNIERVAVYPAHATSGTFTSCALDAGITASWAVANWTATVPTGTSLHLRTRTSVDGNTWSAWSAPLTTSGQTITSPDGRYLQYQLDLATADINQSPVVEALSLGYTGTGPAPTATPTAPPTSVPTNTPTSVPTSVPTNTPTATATATATATPTSGPTATPKPAPNRSVTHTKANDWAQCTPNNTLVSLLADGEVRLAGTLNDEYAAATLDGARWAWGTWNGGTYTPAPSNGVLSLAGSTGAWVRTAATRPVTTLETTAQFSAAPWEHLGWGSLNFANDQYLLFSTFNGTTNLYARSNNGSGEQRTDLGPLPAGFHTYRIERVAQAGSDTIRYFVDNAQVAQHTVPTLPALHVYQSHNGLGGTPALNVERIAVYPAYVANGTFTSCAIDAGATASWANATWTATVPTGTSLQVRTRTSSDGVTWSAWSAPLTTSGQAITSPDGRYLQYELALATTDTNASPLLEAITLNYSGGAAGVQAATITNGPTNRLAAAPNSASTDQIAGQAAPQPGTTTNAWATDALAVDVTRAVDKLVVTWIGDNNPAVARYRVVQLRNTERKVVADVAVKRNNKANGARYEARFSERRGATYVIEAIGADGSPVAFYAVPLPATPSTKQVWRGAQVSIEVEKRGDKALLTWIEDGNPAITRYRISVLRANQTPQRTVEVAATGNAHANGTHRDAELPYQAGKTLLFEALGADGSTVAAETIKLP